MNRLAFAFTLLVGCGSLPGGGDDAAECCDASSSTSDDACIACELDAFADSGGGDALPDAGDAGVGRPQNAACELLLDQCASGLTCRYTGVVGTPFSCQPTGPRAVGEVCVSTSDCGANMGCFPGGGGMRYCGMFCDTTNPVRCQVDETCYDLTGLPPEYPAETGNCGP